MVHRLADLTQDDPVQQNNVKTLDRVVNERLRLIEETSQLGRSGLDAEVREMEKRNGLAASTQISQAVAEMMGEEGRLLDLRKQATQVADFETNALLVAGSIATIILLLWSYRIVRRYTTQRDHAESEVRQTNQQLQEKIAQLDRLNLELEDRVKERTASLERSNLNLQQFAFVASHDLQEPLRMVVSYVELLKRAFQGKLDSETEKYMAFAVDGATRMQVLIKDLLAYAQASSQEPVLTRTRLSEVLSQARYSLLASIRETGAEITAGPLPDVDVDPLKMGRVFQNLLSNAIKFRRPGTNPRIQIAAQKKGSEWQVSFHDEGIGFEPQYAEKIFVVFQRLNGKSAYPGTGLGLAICKRIIEGHGGRIWAEAHPGAGATFHFTLPVSASSEAATNPASMTSNA
jgi:signal transduction histidine kinase